MSGRGGLDTPVALCFNHSMRRRIPPGAGGLVVVALLAAIGSDILADRCHELPVPSQADTALQDAGQESHPDPCATVCVPDCFCCARSTVAAPLLILPSARPLGAPDKPSAPSRRPGVLPLPDPPPLARA